MILQFGILLQNDTLQRRKEGNVLFNDALNTFYLRLYGVRHMVKDNSDSERGNPLPPHRLLFPIERERERERERESTKSIVYEVVAATIIFNIIIVIKIGYSLRLKARVLLYAPSYRQDSTYHSLCYTFVTPVVEHWLEREIAQWVHHMKDRPNDPSHHERTPSY